MKNMQSGPQENEKKITIAILKKIQFLGYNNSLTFIMTVILY